MKVSAIKSYDYVHKNNNGPQQPCPAPMPYATNPNFKASASQAVTGLKGLGKKILGFVAAMGLFSGVAVQKAYGQQQVDSPFKIYMAVKGSNGKEELKPIGVAPNTDYIFDFNGQRYAVTVDYLLGFGIYGKDNETLYTLPMNTEQYDVIRNLAAIDGNPNELSSNDVKLANTDNLNLHNHKVTQMHYDDMLPGESEVLIEQIMNEKTISYVNVNALNDPIGNIK